MKSAVVWFCGLDSPIFGDWCGMKTPLLYLSGILKAEIIPATWDGKGMDYPVKETLARVVGKYNFIAAGGHSHGAEELFNLGESQPAGAIDIGIFADLCPPWNPAAWAGSPWFAPDAFARVLAFDQSNDTPLRGVQMGGRGLIEDVDVTPWGLHHAGPGGLCNDVRVQTRIQLEILKAYHAKLLKPPAPVSPATIQATAGAAAGGS